MYPSRTVMDLVRLSRGAVLSRIRALLIAGFIVIEPGARPVLCFARRRSGPDSLRC